MNNKALSTLASIISMNSTYAECDTLRELGAANNLLIGAQFKYK